MSGFSLSFGVGFSRDVFSGELEPASTVLRREADGTVTVLSLAKPYTPILTRQSNGSVNVGAA